MRHDEAPIAIHVAETIAHACGVSWRCPRKLGAGDVPLYCVVARFRPCKLGSKKVFLWESQVPSPTYMVLDEYAPLPGADRPDMVAASRASALARSMCDARAACARHPSRGGWHGAACRRATVAAEEGGGQRVVDSVRRAAGVFEVRAGCSAEQSRSGDGRGDVGSVSYVGSA